MKIKSWMVLGWFLSTGCTPASGGLGPTGYEQALVKYKLSYANPTTQKFLPEDWALDNFTYVADKRAWKEKTGDQYRAIRLLDEDGDGTISESERTEENVFDLRFVNSRDSAVIWLKVHPMAFRNSKRDLDVMLENYADGLAGAGLFEQSSLFGLEQNVARQYTTFVVEKQALAVGPLSAIRGVIEIAEVEKLRLDRSHRDSKAELVFAKVAYLHPVGSVRPTNSPWPMVTGKNGQGGVGYFEKRTGLLVIGYYDDAARFEAHLADFHGLLSRLQIPPEAVPDDNAPPKIESAPKLAPLAAPAAAPAPTAVEAAPSAVPAVSASPPSASKPSAPDGTKPATPPAPPSN